MVEDVNNRFYKAFQSLSIEEMEKVWDHSDDAVCIHPGWDLFTGWLAIRESWMTIFQNTSKMEFLITNAKIKMFGDIAVVVCLENIKSTIYEHAIKSGVLATNIFKKLEGDWFMIHHHGSIVTNYLPPNVST
ncbi:MAG TPA: nuclear transport factor 2 family protein [Phototrophicaceae bacterium]|nr:nuclear transport factor 2 family protein [Phototrophicaceae bacterium]